MSSVADPDPGSGAFFLSRDPGRVKNQDKGSGSGMNIPDHISESLATIFWVKNTYIFGCGSGSGIENFVSGIRDKHPGSAPQGYEVEFLYDLH
jgi:hypothetical protein